jgi:Ca2+-binding RTX toxin-like protein
MRNQVREIDNEKVAAERSTWHGVAPTIELLEERRMFAAANGTAGADSISVYTDLLNRLVVSVNGNVVLANPASIEIYGLGGNDDITVNAAVTMGIYIDGGTGGDAIVGGSGDDTIYGGDGIDYIEGNAGHDILYGEDDKDEIHGGDGDDYLDGGADDDILHGDNNDDVVYGGTGADLVYGDAGNDAFGNNADGAVDHLYGGDGSDTVSGFDYSDTMTEIESGTD